MKGIVFDFRKNAKLLRLSDIRKGGARLRLTIRRYGTQTVFCALFLFGLIAGAASCRAFDSSVFDRFDLLFVTNLGARMEMSAFDIFVSCFVSYFLFIFCAFLCAFSAWGFAAVPLLSVFKGFTVGLSSAFIFSLYKLSGIGFYILVILPGTVLFLFTLINYSVCGFRLSFRYMRLSAFGYDREPELKVKIKEFLRKTLFAFIVSGACAAADMLLWILFANKFDFL